MSDNVEITEKKEQIGTCLYCGQERHIQTIGELSPAELDAMATDMCLCIDAVNAKRKKAREEKIKEFVKKKFITPEMCDYIHLSIELLNDKCFEEFQIKQYPDKVVKIWIDNDDFLHIRIKKTEDDELKA